MLSKIQELIAFFQGEFMGDLVAFGSALYFDIVRAELEHGPSGGDEAIRAAKHDAVREKLDHILDEAGGLEWPSFLQDQRYQDMILNGLIGLIVYAVKRGK